jgi:H+/Cl- antiporter ClcA
MAGDKIKKNLRAFADNGLNLVLISIITGLFAGVIVTFYNILAKIGENTAEELYSLVRDNPVFVPLLFVGLIAGAFVIGTLVKFVPMIRGSGIPQIEGASRGTVRFNWYVTMCSMFAASLACIFLGLNAGAEGPSLEIGGCAGEAVGLALRRNKMVRRLQIASGASAGFAVAFNAPVTGLIFAMEEAFRSFSAQVFICAVLSVVTALLTRNAIRPLLGFGTGYTFEGFVFSQFDFVSMQWVVLASIVTSLAGVGFYYAVFATKKLFGKIKFARGVGKYTIPFVCAGAFGLITAYAMGGGHSFIQALATNGTGEIELERIFGISVLATIIIVVVIKFIASVMSMGCGVPCGVFIPMLAIGAGLGGALSILFQRLGMDGSFGDYLVIICMAVFFVTVVKAPITGIVMVFELTGQFTNFVAALLAIAIGYLVGMVFKTEPIYEKSLKLFVDEEKFEKDVVKERVELVIKAGSKADGAAIRTIIWPSDGLVTEVLHVDGTHSVPDGRTRLHAGERIVFECETHSRRELLEYLYEIVGNQK